MNSRDSVRRARQKPGSQHRVETPWLSTEKMYPRPRRSPMKSHSLECKHKNLPSSGEDSSLHSKERAGIMAYGLPGEQGISREVLDRRAPHKRDCKASVVFWCIRVEGVARTTGMNLKNSHAFGHSPWTFMSLSRRPPRWTMPQNFLRETVYRACWEDQNHSSICSANRRCGLPA